MVYLVFTEGYAVADDELAEEAIRLGRLLVELVPDSDEARGLLALMLLQHSRRAARLIEGELVTLEHQDRGRWDAAAIGEALTLGPLPAALPGSYRLQAELAAVHATAVDPAGTDWTAIVGLYDDLLVVQPSPVVELNRAIAVGMALGPVDGLAALDRLGPALEGHHLLFAVRGELLARAGRPEEAALALQCAAEEAPTGRERRQLEARRAELLEQP